MFRNFTLLLVALAFGIAASVGVSSVLETKQIAGDGVANELGPSVRQSTLTASGTGQETEEVTSLTNRPVEFWPPIDGQRYPDLVLEDSHGQLVRLSDHAGKVILIELAAVPCKGCQAFAGGKQYGGFAGIGVQSGLDSIHHYARNIASIDLKSSNDVLLVQLLLYGKGMGAPTREETQGWAEHFRIHDRDHQFVLRGDPSMVNRTTYNMIPGFHLIDRDFILRSDSCGHQPKANLYTELLPKLKNLARQPRPSKTSKSKVDANPFFQE